jgi:hypothetical protein
MFSIIKSREIPYLSTSLTEELEANRHEMTSTMNLRYDNLLKEGAHWQSNDLVIRMSFFFRRRIQKLCKNTVRIYMYKLMSRYFTLLYAALRYSTQLYATLRYSTLLYATLRYSTLLYATLLLVRKLAFIFAVHTTSEAGSRSPLQLAPSQQPLFEVGSLQI